MSENNKTFESQISEELGLTREQLVFSFKQVEGITILDLITHNPRHNQSFLFHTVKAINKEEAYEKMLEYIQEHIQKDSSYTLQWVKIGDNNLQTSYFRAKDIYELLDKFYFERDINSYRVFSISLNPVS